MLPLWLSVIDIVTNIESNEDLLYNSLVNACLELRCAMDKPKKNRIDFGKFKEQVADLKDSIAEKVEQGADAASDVAAKAIKQGGEFTNAAAEKIKQGAELAADAADSAQDAFNKWWHQPIFEDNLSKDDTDWIPDMVYIRNQDDRNQIEGLSEAIGFDEDNAERPIVSLLRSYAKTIDINFYPTLVEGVYYVDPFNRSRYIQLEQYFSVLEQERIEELIRVAQDLGASYIEIAYSKDNKQSKTSSRQANVEAKMKGVSANGDASGQQQATHSERSKMDIKKQMSLPGTELKEPTLRHFKNDIEINSLIDRRLHKENAIKGDYKCELSFNNSSGIKMSNAANIEGALKKVGIKAKGKLKISEEVSREDSQRLRIYLKFPERKGAVATTIEELYKQYELDESLRKDIDGILEDNKITLSEFMDFVKKHDVNVSVSDFSEIVKQAKELGLIK